MGHLTFSTLPLWKEIYPAYIPTVHINYKDPEGQVAGWLETLAEFEYTIIHRPDVRHTNADSLPRRECHQCGLHLDSEEFDEVNVASVTGASVVHSLLPVWTQDKLRALKMAEDDIKSAFGWLEPESVPTDAQISHHRN